MLNFSESGHPAFRAPSAVELGDLKSKGKEKLSIHFCGDDKPLKWFFARSSPACKISDCSERTGEPVAQDNPEATVIPTELMTTTKSPRTDENVQGNLLQNYEQKFATLPNHLQLTKLCSNVGITKTVARDSTSRPSLMRSWKIGKLMSRV